MKMLKKFSLVAALTFSLSCSAYAASVDYALTTQGATFVSASSEIFGPNSTMETDLISNVKTAWFSNGDTSFIFGGGDQNQWVTINLGTSRSINSIGAAIDLIDRPVNPSSFAAQVSTNGTIWTNWTGTTTLNSGSGMITISGAAQNVQYVKYDFGIATTNYGGGSRVVQVYADNVSAVPEPESYGMMLAGLGLLSFMVSRKKSV